MDWCRGESAKDKLLKKIKINKLCCTYVQAHTDIHKGTLITFRLINLLDVVAFGGEARKWKSEK